MRRVKPLRRSASIPADTFARYATGGSAVRIARLLDLVVPGSRILDIGVGHGYVGGVLLRDRAPDHYCGVDLRPAFIEHTRGTLAANGLADGPVELVASDIFDLDEAFWRRHEPDVVLMLEMLEHVTDPARALRAVAAAVEPGARVIFTVPLHGRLDSVWGHRSTFDRARLMRLCRYAGLAIEKAEPLQSTWALIAARASGTQPPQRDTDSEPGFTFEFLGPKAATEQADGSIRIPVREPRVLRLRLSVAAPPGATLAIRGLDAAANELVRWQGPAERAERKTYLLRPGQDADGLRSQGARDPRGIHSVEVAARPGGPDAAVAVHRAAFVPERA